MCELQDIPRPNLNGLCICGEYYALPGSGHRTVKMVIPVHLQDHHLHEIQSCGDTFVNQSLSFSLQSTSRIFIVFSDKVAWAIHHGSVCHLLHYLDDFLLF